MHKIMSEKKLKNFKNLPEAKQEQLTQKTAEYLISYIESKEMANVYGEKIRYIESEIKYLKDEHKKLTKEQMLWTDESRYKLEDINTIRNNFGVKPYPENEIKNFKSDCLPF